MPDSFPDILSPHLPPDEFAADHDGRLDGVRVHRLRRVPQVHMKTILQPPTLNLLKKCWKLSGEAHRYIQRLSSACGRSFVYFVFDLASKHTGSGR